MYPTVNGLMDLWRFVIAREIRVVTSCQEEIKRFLRSLTPEKLFFPNTWKRLPAFVKVVPDGDLLPSRAKYSSASNDWQVAVNYLFPSDHAASQGLWFSLPDVAASVLLTRKVPKIVDAFKLVPSRKAFGLETGPSRWRGMGKSSNSGFVSDGDRTTQIITQRKNTSEKMWTGWINL